MSERSKLETTLDVLRAVEEGAERINYIMLKAKLSRVRAQSAITQLIRQGLILQADEDRYFITVRGRGVLAEMLYLLTDFPHISEAAANEEAVFVLPP